MSPSPPPRGQINPVARDVIAFVASYRLLGLPVVEIPASIRRPAAATRLFLD
jgi:hypothetical protein